LRCLKDDQVLPGKDVDALGVLEAHRLHLLSDLNFRHLVQRLDLHFRILRPVFDDPHAAARFQRAHDLRHDFEWKFELVIHTDHEHEIDATRGQSRIIRPPAYQSDVGRVQLPGLLP
jgi:hypothetical protein